MKKTEEFNQSNKVWNDLGLNSKTNVGCLMALIKDSKATTLEEWSDYYFKTGEEKRELLKKFVEKKRYFDICATHGRTEDDLIKIAEKLKDALGCSLETAYNYVYIRVIDETWTGHSREVTALMDINKMCRNYGDFKANSVDYHTDFTYAVDLEIREDKKLILGVQLKPISYLTSTNPGVADSKRFNERKNKAYTDEFGAEVFYLYVNRDDSYYNFNDLQSCLENHIAKSYEEDKQA